MGKKKKHLKKAEKSAFRVLRISRPSPDPMPDMADVLAPAKTMAHADPGYAKACTRFKAVSDALPGQVGGYCDLFDDARMSRFIGYPRCADLTQDGLMQAGVETVADEMTRKFPEFRSTADNAGADAAKLLNEEMNRLDVRRHFHTMAEFCGYFGGGLLFMDFGRAAADLEKPIALTPEFVSQGSLRRLVPVEPMNVAPLRYESTNPLSRWFFRPELWYVTGVGPVHASHFMRFMKSEPPMLLRPMYNFFGVPDVQKALDYLAHFTGTRESAARLLEKFSLTVVKTNVDALLYGSDDSDVRARLDHLAKERSNDGVYAISYEDEDIVQINTPLSGVTDIVRQALELLSCIWRIPVVKFLGISPGGMNATGESDIRSFYDHVDSQRQKIFSHHFATLARVMQLSALGRLDESVTYDWPELWAMTAKERAEIAKLNAESDALYIDRFVVDQEEVRRAVSADETGRYAQIVPEDVPEVRADYEAESVASGLPDKESQTQDQGGV